MQNTKIKLGLGVMIIIIAGMLYIIFHSPETKTETDVAVSGTQEYSMSDVTSHSNETNCWTAIRGNVYDLTSWIKEHPGGAEAILWLCGKDGTEAFVGQHGGQSNPEAELQSFLIGKLK